MKWLSSISLLLASVLLSFPYSSPAQGCYTDPIYAVTVETGVVYGSATNYCGFEEELMMDIYRPVGDTNMQRPAIVLVHGGAFLNGDKGSYDMEAAATAFAARGYLAVSINYRLGFHKSAFHTPDAQGCALIGGLAGVQNAQCLYAAPLEVERALYRAVQDVRGAIRFVKSRIDSVDAGNVFVGGGSAGGFIAMTAAYMEDDEAPAAALEQTPLNGIPFIYGACHPSGCDTGRPALGPPQGDLHLGQEDASVKGVLNIFGALFDPALIDPGDPMLYSFHKDNDLVVPCDNGRPFRNLVTRCLNNAACTAMPNTWPEAFGSCRLEEYLDSLPNAPAREFHIESCPLPVFPCGSSCHEVTATEVQQIVQGAAAFWGCTIVHTREQKKGAMLRAYPSPARTELVIQASASTPPLEVAIYNMNGQPLRWFTARGELKLNVSDFPPGVYFLRWSEGREAYSQRIVIQR